MAVVDGGWDRGAVEGEGRDLAVAEIEEEGFGRIGQVEADLFSGVGGGGVRDEGVAK